MPSRPPPGWVPGCPQMNAWQSDAPLVTDPRRLISDEATPGLAPPIGDAMRRCLAALKRAGQPILVIDKTSGRAPIAIAHRHYAIERNGVRGSGTSRKLAVAAAVRRRYLGVELVCTASNHRPAAASFFMRGAAIEVPPQAPAATFQKMPGASIRRTRSKG